MNHADPRCDQDRRRTEAVLFGRERCGGSVCVTVTGWQPYLLIRAPSGWEVHPLNLDAPR